jgi:hypothetical protein
MEEIKARVMHELETLKAVSEKKQAKSRNSCMTLASKCC